MNTKITFKVNGRDLTTDILQQDKDMMVAIRPICEAIGVDFSSQSVKLRKNPQFWCCDITTPDGRGRPQDMTCLPVRQIGMWLCGINANRVSPEIRDTLIQFQEWCQIELHAAITGRAGMERVEALERAILDLQEQNRILSANFSKAFEVISHQQNQINYLTQQQDAANVLVGQEQVMASMDGMLLNRARSTKKIRRDH